MDKIEVTEWNPETQTVKGTREVNVAEIDSVIDIKLPYKENFLPGCKVYTSTGKMIRCRNTAIEIHKLCHAESPAASVEEQIEELETEINEIEEDDRSYSPPIDPM